MEEETVPQRQLVIGKKVLAVKQTEVEVMEGGAVGEFHALSVYVFLEGTTWLLLHEYSITQCEEPEEELFQADILPEEFSLDDFVGRRVTHVLVGECDEVFMVLEGGTVLTQTSGWGGSYFWMMWLEDLRKGFEEEGEELLDFWSRDPVAFHIR